MYFGPRARNPLRGPWKSAAGRQAAGPARYHLYTVLDVEIE